MFRRLCSRLLKGKRNGIFPLLLNTIVSFSFPDYTSDANSLEISISKLTIQR